MSFRALARAEDRGGRARWRSRSVGGLILTMAIALVLVGPGCGETRRPLGDECLRDDDCLSSACSGRVCVAAPPLTNDQLGPPDRGAKLPDATTNLVQEAGAPFGG